jgi:hypothetical protein
MEVLSNTGTHGKLSSGVVASFYSSCVVEACVVRLGVVQRHHSMVSGEEDAVVRKKTGSTKL